VNLEKVKVVVVAEVGSVHDGSRCPRRTVALLLSTTAIYTTRLSFPGLGDKRPQKSRRRRERCIG
jgi:hypothetical protein